MLVIILLSFININYFEIIQNISSVNFLKIMIILCKRLINNRLLSVLLSENILHSWQTTIFVNVNITIPTKYALTRSTETFTTKSRSSKAN